MTSGKLLRRFVYPENLEPFDIKPEDYANATVAVGPFVVQLWIGVSSKNAAKGLLFMTVHEPEGAE